MITGKVYKITNIVNNKIYIGKTIKELSTRFSEHFTTAKRWAKEDAIGKKHPYQSKLYPAMNSYGYENFKIELIEEVDYTLNTTLEEREKYWIKALNATNHQIGYNIAPGGYGGALFKGHKQSDYCKQKNSARSKGIPQDKAFVQYRTSQLKVSIQDLTSGEVFSSVKDFKLVNRAKWFNIDNYKIANILKPCSGEFITAILELGRPKDQIAPLSKQECLELFKKAKQVFETKKLARYKKSTTKVEKPAEAKEPKRTTYWNDFITKHNINVDTYKKIYLQYKINCPNKHLELLFNIPYNQVRALNKYLGLFGGGSSHKSGKITIEKNN